MTKLRNTTDTELGVPVFASGPRSVMHPLNFQNIAATQAQTYERLTNQDCDGSGSPATGNEGHDHTEDHNQPHVTLLCRSFGIENGTNPGTLTEQFCPLTIVNDASDAQNVTVIYSPFFVPSGLAGRSLLLVMHIEGNGAPGVKATLETWSGSPATPTTVTGHDRLTLRRGTEHPAFSRFGTDSGALGYQLWWVRLYPVTTGLHTIKITTDVQYFWQDNRKREIRNIMIMNEPHWGSMAGTPDVRKADLPQANMVDVGDSRNANGWTCPTDKLFPWNGAGPGMLSPGVRFLALNDAWLQEKALGLPAAGQATMTVSAGHSHTGASADGAEIEIPILAMPVEKPPTSNGTIYGNGGTVGDGASDTSNTYRQIFEFYLYTPDHTYALDEVANPRLWGAVLLHGETSKVTATVCKITTTETTPGTSSVEYATDPALASPFIELVTDSVNAFTFTPGGRTKVKIEIKVTKVGATGVGTLLGFCFWLSATPP